MGRGDLKRMKSHEPKLKPKKSPEPDPAERADTTKGSVETTRDPASFNGEPTADSAERGAAQIRADAEAKARRYLEDYKRRLDEMFDEKSRVADELVEQADEIKTQYERFMSTVELANERDTAAELPSWPDSDTTPSTPTRGGFRPRPTTSEKIPARALVAQMVADGADREAVSRCLREEHGIDDASALLNEFEL